MKSRDGTIPHITTKNLYKCSFLNRKISGYKKGNSLYFLKPVQNVSLITFFKIILNKALKDF